ncbi:hypothetical protein [Pedobacter psychrodurus]|uniref:hypothetical protein n=1 Tax=Pedobacter psychrodurus TaxID=2530456 RepID=UPI00292D3676|nr:hypothetical protein [Pedobacter psychrodurus]
MNYSIFEPEMPRLNLSQEELKQHVSAQLKLMNGDSFQYNGIIARTANFLNSQSIGFTAVSNTSYKSELNSMDKGRIREIIWDFIILRYITIGSYNGDEWPHLSFTELGKTYFSAGSF